jgi:hypothetical protein
MDGGAARAPRSGGAKPASGYDNLDIAKSVFQVHGIDAEGKVVVRLQLKCRDVCLFSISMQPYLVGFKPTPHRITSRTKGFLFANPEPSTRGPVACEMDVNLMSEPA